MIEFSNLDLLSVGVAIAGMIILAFAVYYSDKESFTNKTFLIFAFFGSLWGMFNYLYNQPGYANAILWLLRIHAFFAVWYVYFLFQLFYVFPEKTFTFSKLYKYLLIPFVSVSSVLTLTPFVFSSISAMTPEGRIQNVDNGLGIYLFGATVTFLMVGAMVILLRKTIKTKGIEKRQFDFVLFGAAVTFSLHIVFNFILPAFLDNPSYVPLGGVFIFPFVAFTSYAIIRHHLLNIKVIATEVLVFLLAVVSIIEVVFSRGIAEAIFRTSVFLLVLSIGVVLNRSVRVEIEQKEQLAKLDKELETANSQLKVLDQARAEFISIASHQLRTPPATIKWYLAAILGGDFGPISDQVKKAVQNALMTDNSLISLIDDLLNASRIERGKMEFIFEPTDLIKITSITVDQLLPLAAQKKQKLSLALPKGVIPDITADKEKLRQVVNNFIDNAIKYTPQGGNIDVTISKTAKDIVVKVKDNGKGISKENLKGVFEKYNRGGNKTDSQGLGLGLYVAKVVVEQHKGKIWAESEGEGKGSTFALSLPIKSNLKVATYDLRQDQMAK